MAVRYVLTGIVVFAALGQAGCATVSGWVSPPEPVENPLVVSRGDFDTVWNATVAVVNDYFSINTEDRIGRKIVTEPRIGATLLEPWNGDSVGMYDRLESTLQTMRRFAEVTVNPAPGGGFLVKVVVYKELEDLVKPDRQQAGRAVFNNDFPINRTHDIVGALPAPSGWIQRGRDPNLERVILKRIRDSLFL
jgi:hypothetical protein